MQIFGGPGGPSAPQAPQIFACILLPILSDLQALEIRVGLRQVEPSAPSLDFFSRSEENFFIVKAIVFKSFDVCGNFVFRSLKLNS